MRFRKRSTPSDQELAAYLEDDLSVAEGRRVESQLADSLDGRRRLHQLSSIRARLTVRDLALERIDLVPALDRAIAQPVLARSPAIPAWLWAVAALAVTAVVLFISPVAPGANEYRPKSALHSTAAKVRAGVQLWRADETRPPQAVGAEISRRDGMLFSVSNLGPAPFTHLMVFAVDAGRAIRWFYPAYVKEGTDPASIPLAPQQLRALLPNEIHHDYAPGPLTIFALFSYEPLRVSRIEAWLATNQHRPREPPLPAAKLQTFDLVVNP